MLQPLQPRTQILRHLGQLRPPLIRPQTIQPTGQIRNLLTPLLRRQRQRLHPRAQRLEQPAQLGQRAVVPFAGALELPTDRLELAARRDRVDALGERLERGPQLLSSPRIACVTFVNSRNRGVERRNLLAPFLRRHGKRVDPARKLRDGVPPLFRRCRQRVEAMYQLGERRPELRELLGHRHLLDALDPDPQVVRHLRELLPPFVRGRRDRLDARRESGQLRPEGVRAAGGPALELLLEVLESSTQQLRRLLELRLPVELGDRDLVDAGGQSIDAAGELRHSRGRRGGHDDLGGGQDDVRCRTDIGVSVGPHRRLGGRSQLLEGRPLVGESARQLEARKLPARDEDLTEPRAGRLLLLERLLQLGIRDEPALDEDLADRPLHRGGRDGRYGWRIGRLCGGQACVRGLALLGLPLALVLRPLLGQRAREVEPLDAELLDEDLPDAYACRTLLLERQLELLLGDQSLLDEDRADQPGGNDRRIHGRSIGNPSFEL